MSGPEIVMFSDIVEENGKTIRENRTAIKHGIPIGTLVEVKFDKYLGGPCGMAIWAHLYVVAHHRDCDGSPLYMLASTHPDEWEEAFNATVDEFLALGIFNPKRLLIKDMLGMFDHAFGEDSLTEVPIDEHSDGGRYTPTAKKAFSDRD
jgi:hypothetical protein